MESKEKAELLARIFAKVHSTGNLSNEESSQREREQ